MALVSKALKLIARVVPMNETARRVMMMPLSEQLLYVERLLAFNASLKLSTSADETVYDHAGKYGVVARFNQLPCTPQTRRDRADLFERSGLREASILLLGDDDLVSVELSRRGFTDVTVADCDETLLGVIDTMTASNNRRPHVIKADFIKGFKTLRPSAAVCLDPPYNAAAVRLFLDVALANVDATAPHTLFVMYNPYLVGSAGRQELESILERAGYSLKKRLEGFNSYRLNRAQGLLIRLSGVLLFGRRGRLPARTRLHYFSDCFIFESKATAKRPAPAPL